MFFCSMEQKTYVREWLEFAFERMYGKVRYGMH